jgi:hypothetical protein
MENYVTVEEMTLLEVLWLFVAVKLEVKIILICWLEKIKAITVLINYNLRQVHIDILAIQNVSYVTKKLLIQTVEINSACITVARSTSYSKLVVEQNIRKNNFKTAQVFI